MASREWRGRWWLPSESQGEVRLVDGVTLLRLRIISRTDEVRGLAGARKPYDNGHIQCAVPAVRYVIDL